MPDIFTKAKRSEVMSRIRGRGNKDTELALARLLRAAGIKGWRRHLEIRGRAVRRRRQNPATGHRRPTINQRTSQRNVPTSPKRGAHGVTRPAFRVKPDFVFRQVRLALFVDGCFWHGCPKHCNMPASNRPFWRKKLAANMARDRRVNRALRRAGWEVVRVWECELPRQNSGVRSQKPEWNKCLRRIQQRI
jgi:DNA mismatch endonuclease, patch repair protein